MVIVDLLFLLALSYSPNYEEYHCRAMSFTFLLIGIAISALLHIVADPAYLPYVTACTEATGVLVLL